jgi:pimeloyl-ACP methyl ester carboxylesterase
LTVVATGDRLVLYAESALQDTGSIPSLPLLIASTAAGNNDLLTVAFGQFAAPSSTAQGVYYAVLCNEEVPFVTPEIVAAATAGVREEIKKVSLAFETQPLFDICAFWGSPPPAAIENQPVVSDIPTLILSGEYDPLTPPAFGQLVAQTLSHSSFFEFPGFGHGALGSDCSVDLARAFLTDPSQPVDGSCVAAIPPPQFVQQ